MVNATPRPLYARERPGTHFIGVVGPQSRCGRVRKISPPTGIRSPDCPARSESLYCLRYPGPIRPCCMYINHWAVKGQCFNWLNDFAERNSGRPVKSLRSERPTAGFVCLDFLAAGVSICFTFELKSYWMLRKTKRFSTHLIIILRVWC